MNNKHILHVMVGLPGSGKSTYIKNNAKDGDVILSSDAIRKELFGDINNQENNEKVFNTMRQRLKAAMDEGKDIWYEAMNHTTKSRREIFQHVHDNYEIRAEVIATPIEKCIQRAQNPDRELELGDHAQFVVKRRAKEFNLPVKSEGFDEINFVFSPKEELKNLAESLPFISREMHLMDHENPHHLETVGAHAYNVQKVNEEYTKLTGKRIMHPVFAYLHDIGKLYTKKYDEKKDFYRFFFHENIGAYILLSEYDLDKIGIPFEEVIKNIELVNIHMKGFDLNRVENMEDAYGYDKLVKTYGREILEEVAIFNRFDNIGSKTANKITVHLDDRASAYVKEQDIIDYVNLLGTNYTSEAIAMTAKEIYEGEKREYSKDEFNEYLKDELQANMAFLNDQNISVEPEEEFEL